MPKHRWRAVVQHTVDGTTVEKAIVGYRLSTQILPDDGPCKRGVVIVWNRRGRKVRTCHFSAVTAINVEVIT